MDHVMLVPQEGYWGWVQAARDYGVLFRVSITANPQNALDHQRPNQVVTIVDSDGGYPIEDEIVGWFLEREPDLTLDVIAAETPDELQTVLANRIGLGLRFGRQRYLPPDPDAQPAPAVPPPASATFPDSIVLLWPTNYQEILQPFGVNPDLYRRWGLPGHGGLDIRAPLNAPVYAAADGDVLEVHNGRGGHPYGIHIRVQHANGWQTVYGHLNQARVSRGQPVAASQQIGLAGRTGISSFPHLHFGLIKEGATAANQTSFPDDLVDPAPLLVFPADRPEPEFPPELWPPGVALVGLHGRADGRMQPADWEPFAVARVEALKLLSSAAAEDVDTARARAGEELFLMVRLFADFRGRAVRAGDFAEWVSPDMERFYERGVRHFEVHNEPNLTAEGFGLSWNTGQEFGEWMLEVIGALRPRFPQALFGWPGLSPGPSVSGIRYDEKLFLRSAGSLVRQADWIGCHCYWRTEADLLSEHGGLGYRYYREEYPDRLLFITEFSNPAAEVGWTTKGDQYRRYYEHLRSQPGVGAAFSFVVSASANFPHEVWRREDGSLTGIAHAVRSRSF